MEITTRTSRMLAGKLSVSQDGRSAKDYTQLGKKGQIISGIITNVSDKISIDFSGTEVKVAKGAVRDAKEGEERKFEIKDVAKNSIVLKEVESGKLHNQKAIVRTVVCQEPGEFTSGLASDNAGDTEEQSGTGSVSGRMTGADANALEDEGMSLEKYSKERLDRALTRIKEQRMAKEAGIENAVEKQEEKQQGVKKIALNNVLDAASNQQSTLGTAQISAVLAAADLPITGDNISKVSTTMNMASVAPALSDSAMSYMIEKDWDPTIGNVYRSQYAGSSSKYGQDRNMAVAGYQSANVYYEGGQKGADSNALEADWNEIAPQAEKIIEESGMEVNTENMQKAKWLFMNELPITDETMNQLKELQAVKKEYNPEEVLTKVVQKMALGEEPETVSLLPSDFSDTQKQIDAFLSEVNAQAGQIDTALQQGTGEQMAEQLQLSIPVEKTATSEQNSKMALLTRRRQLEEVRLKMTVDAANRLEVKGIDLDIKQVEKVVDGLKELENDYYRSLLVEGGCAADENEVHLLRNTMETVAAVKEMPGAILGKTLAEADTISIQKLYEVGQQTVVAEPQQNGIATANTQQNVAAVNTSEEPLLVQNNKYTQANTAYDTMMTRPDAELGDSMQKAFSHIGEVLQDMGLEATEGNIRAVKILGYNQMPITEDNIYQVKAYDQQVNRLLNDLHPATTVELIKRNINPLQMSISELDETVVEIKDELGITDDEKYSKYLYSLEKSNGISKEDRNTFVNIYRLLNNVQKMSGAAVGYVLQTDREFTLENLLTAVRTLRGNGVEMTASDSQDMKDVTYSRYTLLSEVNKAFNKTEEPEAKEKYYTGVVDALAEEISPSALERLTVDTEGQQQQYDQLFRQDAEQLLEQLRKANGEKTQEEKIEEQTQREEYAFETVKNLQQVSDNSDRIVSYLEANHLPATVENILAASDFANSFKKLQEKSRNLPKEEQEDLLATVEGMEASLGDASALQSKYEELSKKVEQMLDVQMADQQVTSMDIRELRSIANSVGLMKQLARREDYQIPLVQGDQITNMHLTVVSGTDQDSKVEIAMHSQKLGEITAEFQVREQTVDGKVFCISKKAMDTLQERLGEYEQELKEQGMGLGHVIYGLHTRYPDSYKTVDKNTENETQGRRQLYQVAKAFVSHISMLEQEE